MKANGWGRIVNIASQAGRTRTDIAGAHYAASKAGMMGLARTLAVEVGKDGITCNSIAPGRIETPMAAEAGAAVNAAYLTRIPVGRLGTPDDVAAAVAFLASDEAGFISGVTLDVNGGAFMI
jgi:3-oxoacyl-[acyl-carrier protein] reductase